MLGVVCSSSCVSSLAAAICSFHLSVHLPENSPILQANRRRLAWDILGPTLFLRRTWCGYAEKWQEAIHSKLEKSARLERLTEVVEGVHRTVNDPPPKETRDGKAPKWWQLPSRPFRLTERMRWGSGANYADAVYSCFDPSTNTLWIVDISEQHGELWVRGNVPNGRQFLLSRPNNLNPQNVEIHSPNDLEAKGGELKKDLVPQVDENR